MKKCKNCENLLSQERIIEGQKTKSKYYKCLVTGDALSKLRMLGISIENCNKFKG